MSERKFGKDIVVIDAYGGFGGWGTHSHETIFTDDFWKEVKGRKIININGLMGEEMKEALVGHGCEIVSLADYGSTVHSLIRGDKIFFAHLGKDKASKYELI